jgi:hypothetical protein
VGERESWGDAKILRRRNKKVGVDQDEGTDADSAIYSSTAEAYPFFALDFERIGASSEENGLDGTGEPHESVTQAEWKSKRIPNGTIGVCAEGF